MSSSSPDHNEHCAVTLMREALALLDADGLSIAACHLSMAIDAALAAPLAVPAPIRAPKSADEILPRGLHVS